MSAMIVYDFKFYNMYLLHRYLINLCLDKKAYEEAAKRLKLENEREKEKVIPRLRVESRRKYLEKRKEDKVIELEANILDDEYLFDTEE